ncbi:hypothetical protein NWE55_01690 [Myroides albus]|uniref:WG repeat-containing protein n=1 Tax=Myroides albus TaxID=2562892 RepID=A0A6I3LI96_9FLAO|nr:hypothetical protein [Myroides albus]MTG99319.1 hypothetical protein [Myroides albus]UVD80030.1 hypothetical protein NWE55_01690 [Myroides albus]
MIKKIIFAVLFLMSFVLSAQEGSYSTQVEERLTSQIKPYSSKDLTPYYDKKSQKWGYMHRISKKKLSQPFIAFPIFFCPDLDLHVYQMTRNDFGLYGKIKGSYAGYDSRFFDQIAFLEPEIGVYNPMEYSYLIDTTIKGFRVNHLGELTGISPTLYDEVSKRAKVFTPFSYRDQFYAVIVNGDHAERNYAIIHQNGAVVEGFADSKEYPDILQKYSSQSDLWVVVGVDKERYRIKGLLSGKTISEVDTQIIHQLPELAYGIVSQDGEKGIWDFLTMQWVITPSKKNDFISLYYSSSEEVDTFENVEVIDADLVKENRDKVYLYILNSKNTFYDLSKKEYKPKGDRFF